MNSRSRVRLAVCAVSAAMLCALSAPSHAGRSVRSDSGDGAFEFLGGFWGTDNQQFGPGVEAGQTPFKLKFRPKGGAHYYKVCMSEGFVTLIATDASCADADYARPPAGNYIAAFAADQEDGSGSFIATRGFVDVKPPFRMGQAAPAMRFWWNGVTLAGDFNTFDVQILLIDRSKGRNNGDFDIEMNYGTGGGDQVPPIPSADGFQGLALGPFTRGPVFGPFGPFDTDGAPIRFCFRDGRLRASC